jgi:hypothetical protein
VALLVVDLAHARSGNMKWQYEDQQSWGHGATSGRGWVREARLFAPSQARGGCGTVRWLGCRRAFMASGKTRRRSSTEAERFRRYGVGIGATPPMAGSAASRGTLASRRFT